MNRLTSLVLSALAVVLSATQAQADLAIPIAVILPGEPIETDLSPAASPVKPAPEHLAPATPIQFKSSPDQSEGRGTVRLRPGVAYWSPKRPVIGRMSHPTQASANFASGLDATVLVALSRALPQTIAPMDVARLQPESRTTESGDVVTNATASDTTASDTTIEDLPEFVAERVESSVTADTQTALNRTATQINGQFLTPSLRQALIEGSGLPQPKSVTPIDRRLGRLVSQTLGRSPSSQQSQSINKLSRNLTGLTVNGHVNVEQLTAASRQLNGLLTSLSISERQILASEPSIAELIRVLAQLSVPLL